jgi:hypothetical protein
MLASSNPAGFDGANCFSGGLIAAALLHLHINAAQRTRHDRDSNAIFWCLGCGRFLSQRSVTMATIQEEKSAKARARNRKDRRSSKNGQPQVEAKAAEAKAAEAKAAEVKAAEVKAAEAKAAKVKAAVRAEAEPVCAMMAETDAAVTKAEAVAIAAPVVPSEQAVETALSGEVLPPEVRALASETAGLQAITQAYGEYARNSWLNGRFLAERLIAARSFDEAIEIQGEFAKRACANFLTQSERICVIYGEWAQQFFRPFEKLAAERPRIGR